MRMLVRSVVRGFTWRVERVLWSGFRIVGSVVMGRGEGEVSVRSSKRRRVRRVR